MPNWKNAGAYLGPNVVPVHNSNGQTRHMPLLQQLADIFSIFLGERAAYYALIMT